MPAMRRHLIRIVLAAALIVAAGLVVLCTPQPLVAHQIVYGR